MNYDELIKLWGDRSFELADAKQKELDAKITDEQRAVHQALGRLAVLFDLAARVAADRQDAT